MRLTRYFVAIRDFFITVIGAVFFVLYVMIYGGLVLLIGRAVRKKRGEDAAKRFVSREVGRFGRNVFRTLFCKVQVRGAENVPEKGPMVIICNHQSVLDIPLVPGYIYDGIAFIAKKEISKIPVVRGFVNALDGVFIARGDRTQTASTLRKLITVLRKGGTIMLFPEGTRSEDGKLLPFKEGSFMLPYRTGTVVLPVAIDGTGRLMKKKQLFVRPGRVCVNIMEPLEPASFDSERSLRESAQRSVKQGLEEIRMGVK